MPDFYQTDLVTTPHRLNLNGVGRLEDDLERFGSVLPIGLALPALASEFETPATRGIVQELSEVEYLRRIVVALGRATCSEYERAKRAAFAACQYTGFTVSTALTLVHKVRECQLDPVKEWTC